MDHDAGLDERYNRLWLPPMAEAWLQVTFTPLGLSRLSSSSDFHAQTEAQQL